LGPADLTAFAGRWRQAYFRVATIQLDVPELHIRHELPIHEDCMTGEITPRAPLDALAKAKKSFPASGQAI
jgi:hypothetical protein